VETNGHGEPSLSVVVVVYDMARELPRTLRSLSPAYQRGMDADDYEIVVVDNGSPTPLDPGVLAAFPGRIRALRIDDASPSPVHAANRGLALAEADLVGLLIDGARLASPGLLATARSAMQLAPAPPDAHVVVTTPAWHLGSVTHMRAA
jgi:glycosyltransferase involved in cell wall biosynthesis